jgi:arsenite methyltransferase
MRKPDYGIDAPVMQRNMAILGAVLVALLFLWPSVGVYAVWPGATFLLAALWLRLGSRFGKPKLAQALLDRIPWKGDEEVLDVGCGHGLLTILAAKRLKAGRAVGVDVWREFDQAQNRPEKVLENAKIEGVGRLVEVKDGDARELPFADATFDVVLSSWAIHNIAVGTGRERAVAEMLRVLKPGGWLGMLDIECVGECREVLARAGARNLQRFGPSFLFIAPTHGIVAQKPAPDALAEVSPS